MVVGVGTGVGAGGELLRKNHAFAALITQELKRTSTATTTNRFYCHNKTINRHEHHR